MLIWWTCGYYRGNIHPEVFCRAYVMWTFMVQLQVFFETKSESSIILRAFLWVIHLFLNSSKEFCKFFFRLDGDFSFNHCRVSYHCRIFTQRYNYCLWPDSRKSKAFSEKTVWGHHEQQHQRDPQSYDSYIHNYLGCYSGPFYPGGRRHTWFCFCNINWNYRGDIFIYFCCQPGPVDLGGKVHQECLEEAIVCSWLLITWGWCFTVFLWAGSCELHLFVSITCCWRGKKQIYPLVCRPTYWLSCWWL